MLMIDQFGQCLGIRLVPDVPGDKIGELRHAGAWAGLRHLRHAEIERVGKDRRQQQHATFCRLAALEMSKVPREIRPVIDLKQQIGDLHMRQ